MQDIKIVKVKWGKKVVKGWPAMVRYFVLDLMAMFPAHVGGIGSQG